MALYVAPYVYQKATGYIHNALIFAPAPPSVAGSADGPKSETFSLRRRRTTQRKYMLEGGAGKCLLLHDGQMLGPSFDNSLSCHIHNLVIVL